MCIVKSSQFIKIKPEKFLTHSIRLVSQYLKNLYFYQLHLQNKITFIKKCDLFRIRTKRRELTSITSILCQNHRWHCKTKTIYFADNYLLLIWLATFKFVIRLAKLYCGLITIVQGIKFSCKYTIKFVFINVRCQSITSSRFSSTKYNLNTNQDKSIPIKLSSQVKSGRKKLKKYNEKLKRVKQIKNVKKNNGQRLQTSKRSVLCLKNYFKYTYYI